MFEDMKWMVTVNATSFEAEVVRDVDTDSAIAAFVDEADAKIFAAVKNFGLLSSLAATIRVGEFEVIEK